MLPCRASLVVKDHRGRPPAPSYLLSPFSPFSRPLTERKTSIESEFSAAAVELPVDFGRPEASHRRHQLRLELLSLPTGGIGP